MASRRLVLEPGVWWGGYHAPFFISTAMIQPFLEKQGFSDFKWSDREDGPLPTNVNPKADPRYKDDWEAWVTATYNGATKTVELPHYEYVDWILTQPKATPAVQPKPPAKPPVQWSEVFLVGGLLWWLARRKARR